MSEINLVDVTGALLPADVARLKSFIMDKCLWGPDDLKMLRNVVIRNDGASGYLGYWTARHTVDGIHITDIQAVIILNTFYLKTLTQLERALAHELGHHRTLGNFMQRQEMINWFDTPAPSQYYHIRGLDSEKFTKDNSKGWVFCDKEVLAEDYKYIFSPYKDEHHMSCLVSHPDVEVAEFIRIIDKSAPQT